MNESEWLSCGVPRPMLELLDGLASSRKLRLYGCACCRRIWHRLTDGRLRRAVKGAEQYADHRISDDELSELAEAASDAIAEEQSRAAESDREFDPLWLNAAMAARLVAEPAPQTVEEREGGCLLSDWYAARASADQAAEEAAQAYLVREVFGNPYQTIILDPRWRVPAVVDLARAIYDERAFERLPELADALQEAGCTSAELLNHCRKGGAHVRGCWVLDELRGVESSC